MASYERRMIRVIEHIHADPAGDLSLDRLAEVAAMSRFHWHRVFHGMTGETCAQAVRRVRLHRAACWLVQTDWPVTQVAARAGYPDRHAFQRAFKAAYGAKAVADFVSVGGYDGMAAIFHIIKSAKGGKITADGAIKALRGWTNKNSPRGPIMIDAKTRDIVQNIYIAEVYNDNGVLRHRTLKTFNAVKDKCKEFGVGRCK